MHSNDLKLTDKKINVAEKDREEKFGSQKPRNRGDRKTGGRETGGPTVYLIGFYPTQTLASLLSPPRREARVG